MEQWTGSKLGKEYVKGVYCHPAYLTYVHRTKCWAGWLTSWNQDGHVDGHEFEQTLGDGEGQGSLACLAYDHGVAKRGAWVSDWTTGTNY